MSNKTGGISNDLVTALAARALAAGDPLRALNLVALRDDGPGLALRGIAMAQLGDLTRAKDLLRKAARAFGPRDILPRARCELARAEIALVTRDLGSLPATLDALSATFLRYGDQLNSAHARFVDARRLLLTGRLTDAERAVDQIDPRSFPPAHGAAYELVSAGIAARRIRAKAARASLARAAHAARHAGIASLQAEVDAAIRMLDAPAARLISTDRLLPGDGVLVTLDDIEVLLESGALIVDACRRAVRIADAGVSLAGRPLLFELVHALAGAWPNDVPRNTLIERAFQMMIDEQEDRLRLRVEIGRLRALLAPLAAVISTRRGFALVPHVGHALVILEPVTEDEHQSVLALLADGEAWSSSSMALALGAGQRSVQRALEALEKTGKVQPIGRGRACRWMAAPLLGVTTTLLLPGSLPGE